MAALRPVRGTRDVVGEDARRHRHITETGREVAGRYGYEDIATPVFEFTEVFARTLGETSDVVAKEMYTFTDKGGDQLTLRPENTAGVARALISGALGQTFPLRYFYAGPMFRYERPQKGRFRQFHQIGIELLGAPEPLADVEAIVVGHHVLLELGLADDVVLELNSLGDPQSRQAYRDQLVAYLEGFKDRLSEDSLSRLARNPLRILDSKDEGDREVLRNAPRLDEVMNETSTSFFERVKDGLAALDIPFELNPALVRGLDYYTHTTFEFTTSALGAQGAVVAGGRYDGLVKTMGGPDTPGVGWAAGVERLAMLVNESDLPAPLRPIAVVPVGDEAELPALALAAELRTAGLTVDMGFRGKVGQRLKRATQKNAQFALLLGDEEVAARKVILRDLDAGEQVEIARADLLRTLFSPPG